MSDDEEREEAERLLRSAGITPIAEAAGAIKLMVDNLVEAGMTRWEALFWSAIHVAALNSFPDSEGPNDQG